MVYNWKLTSETKWLFYSWADDIQSAGVTTFEHDHFFNINKVDLHIYIQRCPNCVTSLVKRLLLFSRWKVKRESRCCSVSIGCITVSISIPSVTLLLKSRSLLSICYMWHHLAVSLSTILSLTGFQQLALMLKADVKCFGVTIRHVNMAISYESYVTVPEPMRYSLALQTHFFSLDYTHWPWTEKSFYSI